MSEFKSCAFCGVASGFRCQQCYDMEDYVYDEDKASYWKPFEDEVRADERIKVLDKVEELYKDKSSKIYSQWTEDSFNVPKPSFISSVALVNAICESLKNIRKGE